MYAVLVMNTSLCMSILLGFSTTVGDVTGINSKGK